MSDDEVVDEELDNDAADEKDGDSFAPEESPDDSDGSGGGKGPGFIRGVIFGLIAGVGVGVLRKSGASQQLRDRINVEATPVRGYETGAEDAIDAAPVEGLRALVASLRERIRDARRQAGIASREAEELTHARYAELTRQNDS